MPFDDHLTVACIGPPLSAASGHQRRQRGVNAEPSSAAAAEPSSAAPAEPCCAVSEQSHAAQHQRRGLLRHPRDSKAGSQALQRLVPHGLPNALLLSQVLAAGGRGDGGREVERRGSYEPHGG